MKILILTYGSRGDVQPYAALGVGLRRAGHHVTVATSTRFEDFVRANGLSFAGLSDGLLAIMDTGQGRDLMENTSNLFQVLRRTFSMMKQVGPLQEELLRDGWNAAQEAEPDLILFHPKAYGGPHFAEKLGVPVILGLAIPMLVPTAEYPNMGFPKLKLGAGYNRWTYHFVNWLTGVSAGKYVRAWRDAHGLPRQKRFDLLHTAGGEPIPVLHAISRHVVPVPSDWPDTARLTGYWFLDESPEDGAAGESWPPPPELSAFLEAGPPPVYVGFGSMAGKDPARLASIATASLEKAGLRGILVTGWGGLKADQLPDSILKIDQAPHHWLFPRMAAIVHHGGAGTTAAALRAGKPSVVVPFFGDQPYWGQRVRDLGAGSEPIPQKKLTVEKLTQALREVTTDSAILTNAQKLGREIRAEDGVQEAVSFVEDFAAA